MSKKQTRILLIFLFVTVIATGIKAALNPIMMDLRNKSGSLKPCRSSTESKKKGVWICDMSVQPNSFSSDGEKYQLGEAWIEEAFTEDYFLVWFPRRQKLGWNHLCLMVPKISPALDIDIAKFGTRLGGAGSDAIFFKKLNAGDYPVFAFPVRIWDSRQDKNGDQVPGTETDLGNAVLTPVLKEK